MICKHIFTFKTHGLSRTLSLLIAPGEVSFFYLGSQETPDRKSIRFRYCQEIDEYMPTCLHLVIPGLDCIVRDTDEYISDQRRSLKSTSLHFLVKGKTERVERHGIYTFNFFDIVQKFVHPFLCLVRSVPSRDNVYLNPASPPNRLHSR